MAKWLRSTHPDSLYVSVLTFGEIRKRIDLLPIGKRRFELEHWLEFDLHQWFEMRILGLTTKLRNDGDRWPPRLKAAECNCRL